MKAEQLIKDLVRVLAHAVQLRNGILERLPGHLARLLRVPQHLFANTSEGSKSQSSELLVMHGQYRNQSTLLRSRFQACHSTGEPNCFRPALSAEFEARPELPA